MKNLQKVLAKALACVMVLGLVASAAPVVTSAAKKPSLAPKKLTLQVGKTKKVTLKNAKKAKKTKWTAKPAKGVKLSKKGKTSVTVKGAKVTKKVTLTAKFKLGKKKKSAKMTIKVVAGPRTTTRPPTTPQPGTGTPSTQTPGTGTPGTGTPGTQTPGTDTPTQDPGEEIPGPDGNGTIKNGLWTPEYTFEIPLTLANSVPEDRDEDASVANVSDLEFLPGGGFSYTSNAQYNSGLRFYTCLFEVNGVLTEFVTDLSDFDFMEYEVENMEMNGELTETAPQIWGEAAVSAASSYYANKAETYEPQIHDWAGLAGNRTVRTPLSMLNASGYFNAARYCTVAMNDEEGKSGTIKSIKFIKKTEDDGYVSKDTPQNVSVVTSAIRVKEGETLQALANVSNKNGVLIDGQEVEWSSSDESVATVDEDGLITGVAAQAEPITITATVTGTEVTGTRAITVYNDVPTGIQLSQYDYFRTCTVEELAAGIDFAAEAINATGLVINSITCANPVVEVTNDGGTGAVASAADNNGIIRVQSDAAQPGTMTLTLTTEDEFADGPVTLVMDIIEGYRVPMTSAYNASQNAALTNYDTSLDYQISLIIPTGGDVYNNGIGFNVDLSTISEDNPDLTVADISGVYANATTTGQWLQMFAPVNGWETQILACNDVADTSWTNAALISGQTDVTDGKFTVGFDYAGDTLPDRINTPPSDMTGQALNFAFGINAQNDLTVADVILLPAAE